MRFSIYSEMQYWGGKPREALYEEVLEQIVNADRLGFDAYALVEHFFFDHFSVSADPLQVFAAAAQRTRQINFRTLVHVLPFHNPTVLASRIGVAEIMLGGRYRLHAAGYDFYASGIMEDLAKMPYDKMIADDVVWVGTPQDVIERIETVRDLCEGLTEISITCNCGGLAHWQAIKAQELFAAHVMPSFRERASREHPVTGAFG